jgi:hypothetical protein
MPLGEIFYRNAQRPVLDAPAPRPRMGPGPAVVAERHGRSEGTNGETTLADTDAVIFTASGLPDLWVITARTNGALVTLGTIANREDDSFTVLGGQTIEVRLPRRRLSARNLVGGSNAALSVNCYYAKADEPFEAPA